MTPQLYDTSVSPGKTGYTAQFLRDLSPIGSSIQGRGRHPAYHSRWSLLRSKVQVETRSPDLISHVQRTPRDRGT